MRRGLLCAMLNDTMRQILAEKGDKGARNDNGCCRGFVREASETLVGKHELCVGEELSREQGPVMKEPYLHGSRRWR